jgi:MFS family permease
MLGVTGILVPQIGARALVVAGLALIAVGALVLVAAPDEASYVADLLPGFVLLGVGVGLVFPAVSVTAMSEVQESEAGLASGLMSTAHEIGAALGVAVLSAVAGAAGGVRPGASGFASGYGDGFTAAAVIAGVLAFIALLRLPVVRPAGQPRPAVH